MKFSRLILLLAAWPLLTALPACLSLESEEQKAEAAEKAVLAKHDELMGKMDQLYDLRQQLQKASLPDTVEAGRRQRALLTADGAMMGWMHQYHKPAASVTADQQLAYFHKQQQFIDSVGVLMEHSIDSAQRALTHAQPATQPSTK
ncbi:hypothetical protein [Hymenobacter sp. GOD-10R]|uniref:hypothetical protein n=1 Tax=Hymenobacter sp. GOD-10R TaxID=3093922 RepID=UPI002D79A92E|nr:hypothetical protein [Hymenobacter sp. GOD-10R]WRQ30817.1 hypothetical protein SD425_11140 [Hymenobacter sp. GOD-10R]